MWKRSYWVLQTYLKRPLLWLIVAGVVVSVVCLFTMIEPGLQPVGGDTISRDAIRTFQQLDRVLAEDPGQAVELNYWQLRAEARTQFASSARTTSVADDEREKQDAIHASLERVERLTNVVGLLAGPSVDQATIDRIASFTTLQRLSLHASNTPLDLKPLRELVELRQLQLGNLHRVESLAPLAEMPHLWRLEIHSAALIQTHGLEKISRLKNLRVLGLPNLQKWPGLLKTLGVLSQSGSLERIDYDVSWDQRGDVLAAQSKVPGIRLVPALFRPARHIALIYALFSLVAIMSFIATHLTGQFSLPVAHLAPQFRLPHYGVAGAIASVTVFLLTALLVSVGADVLAATSLILLFGASYVWAGTWIPRTRIEARTSQCVGMLIGFTPTVMIVARFYFPTVMEHYLMSGQVLLPCLFLLAAGGALWRAYRNFETRLRTLFDRGLPAVLSIRDMPKYQAAWLTSQSREVPMHRYRQMSLKVPVLANLVLAVTVLATVAAALGYEDAGRIATLTCFIGSITCVYLIGIRWWQEMPFFAASTMRPPKRTQHVDRLLRDVARDFVRLSPAMLAIVVTVAAIGGYRLEGLGPRIFVSVVVVASTTLAIYAILLWMLAIRTIIGIAVLVLVGYLVCSALVIQVVLLGRQSDVFWPMVVAIFSGCLITAIAAIAVVYARRYYARMEWARFV